MKEVKVMRLPPQLQPVCYAVQDSLPAIICAPVILALIRIEGYKTVPSRLLTSLTSQDIQQWKTWCTWVFRIGYLYNEKCEPADIFLIVGISGIRKRSISWNK